MYFIHHNPSNSNKGWIKKKATYLVFIYNYRNFSGLQKNSQK